MKNFILLIQFFTRIPLKNKVEYEEISYGKITYLLPLIGLIIGIGAFGINYILDIFKLPIYINSLILLYDLHKRSAADVLRCKRR